MSFIGKLFGAGGGGAINALTGLSEVFKGNKTKREQGEHVENMAVHAQHAAEFNVHSSRTWFDSLIDGINRLIRPVFSIFVLLVVFIWPWFDPLGFAAYSVALSGVPTHFWVICGTIIAFWFGSRTVFKDRMVSKDMSKRAVESVARVIDAQKDIKSMAPAPPDASSEPIDKDDDDLDETYAIHNLKGGGNSVLQNFIKNRDGK